MAVGYSRQSAAFIINGATVEASHHNNEYNAVENAFNATTGHNHDGTAGGGAPITPAGLSGLSSNGLAARTSATTFAGRTITGPAAGITVTNGNGVSGNPTLALANDLAALEALASTGIMARTASETYALRTLTAPAAGITVTNGDGVAGNPTLVLANDLAALEALSTTGMMARTASETYTMRTITGTSNKIDVTNGSGVSGNPTLNIGSDVVTLSDTQTLTNKTVNDSTFTIQDDGDNTKKVQFQLSALTTGNTRIFTFPDQDGTLATLDDLSGSGFQPSDADLTALAALASTGLVARTASNTYALRTLTAPAAGITVTNGDGVSGNPTLVLANDLSGLEGLSGTGLAVRTGTSTWTNRTLTAPAAGISVSNGDGVSGNPTLALANDLSALEGLASTGIAVRTGTDAWTQRSIAVSGSGLSISNGSGVSGNPTLSIDSDRVAPQATAANAYRNLQVNSGGTAYELCGPIVSNRNKIINGAMRINQEYGSGSVISAVDGVYFMDGFRSGTANSPAQISATRSTTVPTAQGFTHSMSLTVSSANASRDAADRQVVAQRIEGLSVADWLIGTSSAKQVTLSFWVRSSVTGTYYVYFKNSAANRSYVAAYTINSANTWEFETVTLTLDTSGTWLTDTGIGLEVGWDLGSGSNFNTTAGAWQAGDFTNAAGSANWAGTGSATFFLTGVQLELGPVATPFEFKDMQSDLDSCERYYEKSYEIDTAVGTATYVGVQGGHNWSNSGGTDFRSAATVMFRTRKRTAATVTYYDGAGNSAKHSSRSNGAWTDNIALSAINAGTTGALVETSNNSTGFFVQYTANARL
jgi:hypothetical protein